MILACQQNQKTNLATKNISTIVVHPKDTNMQNVTPQNNNTTDVTAYACHNTPTKSEERQYSHKQQVCYHMQLKLN